MQDYFDITNELVEYDKSKATDPEYRALATRSQLVVLNKIDALDEEDVLQLQSRFQKKGIDTMLISAASRKGLRELVIEIGKRVLK